MPFSRPPLQTLIDRVIADFESRLPGADARLRRSNLNVLSRIHASAAHSLYGFLDWISRQVFPDTAEAENLERWATIWSIPRRAAAFAIGQATATGTNGIVIPAATRFKRADGIEYETDAEVTIAIGTATVALTAIEAGQNGNTSASTALTLATPIAGLNAAATVAVGGITNGADTETDASLRARLLKRIQQPPHGGAKYDYEAWALEVAGVTRAWVYPGELGLGTVTVRFVRDDDASIIPDVAEVAAVQAYIDALRPVTAALTVVAPVAVPRAFTVQLTPNTQTVRDAVTAELTDLIRRESEPGGTILLSHIREAISIASGETNHVLSVPAADVTHTPGQMATMGAITWL